VGWVKEISPQRRRHYMLWCLLVVAFRTGQPSNKSARYELRECTYTAGLCVSEMTISRKWIVNGFFLEHFLVLLQRDALFKNYLYVYVFVFNACWLVLLVDKHFGESVHIFSFYSCMDGHIHPRLSTTTIASEVTNLPPNHITWSSLSDFGLLMDALTQASHSSLVCCILFRFSAATHGGRAAEVFERASWCEVWQLVSSSPALAYKLRHCSNFTQ